MTRLIDQVFSTEDRVVSVDLPEQPEVRIGRKRQVNDVYFPLDEFRNSEDITVRQRNRMRSMSRRHATILQREGKHFIRDDGSKQGTWVNGTKLSEGQKYPLRDGSEILLGDYGLMLREE